MSFDAAYAALKAQHLEGRVRRFPGSSATVALAAQELGTAEGAIAKTMALLGPDGPILVLAAGDRKIDGGSFKRTFHFKPKFVPGTDVEALVGHAPGGVCPFGRRINRSGTANQRLFVPGRQAFSFTQKTGIT